MAKTKKRSGQKAKKKPSKTIKKIVTKKKVDKATNWLLYSGIVFILSSFLYLITTVFLESLFGFIMIISGVLVLLFLIIKLIFYFSNKK